MLVATLILLSAFSIDCWAQLTIDVNNAVDQHAQDLEWCDDFAMDLISGACYNEADIAFDVAIVTALDDAEYCCCSQGLPCC